MIAPPPEETPDETSPAPEAEGSSFLDLGVEEQLARTVEALGFVEPTPIQEAAIPPLLDGGDVVARARTGSGKTAAFALPLLDRLRRTPGDGVRALVLAPTRELALQVCSAVEDYAKGSGLGVVPVYGGASYTPQIRALKQNVPIVVGTPGRLLDLLDKEVLDLSGVEVVVLDEADEMLRMGFIDDVETLLGATPDDRQVALFSATMPPPIRRLVARFLPGAIDVNVEERGRAAVGHIDQRWMRVPRRNKLEALERVLDAEERGATLVFGATKHGCDELARGLESSGVDAAALHGDLNQAARERVLAAFRRGSIDVVVATDVASRGIDVDLITHVLNVDLPGDDDTYVHRIGRTGRAGRDGHAITFVEPGQERRFLGLTRRLKAKVTPVAVPSDADIARVRHEAFREELTATLETLDPEHRHARVEDIAEATGWTAEQVAAAALELLARDRRLPEVGERAPDDRPPVWGREPRPRERHRDERARGRRARDERSRGGGARDERGRDDRARDERGRGERARDERSRGERARDERARGERARDERPRFDKGAQDKRRGGAPQRADVDEGHMQLYLPIGRTRHVRPSDVVGALTRGAGLKGSDIGRIHLYDRHTFVGVTREEAQRLLDAGKPLQVRGRDVPILPAKPRRT